MEIIKIRNLSFTFEGREKAVLNNIDFNIKKGEFAVLYGPSGCGKTTLLRLIKKEMNPEGKISGSILYKGINISKLDRKTSASEIGYVMQNPDSQIITDKVWHEIAFGLESLGHNRDFIRRRTAEISSFFGINSWYRKETYKLSGGQKQLLNLAAVMAISPEVILLDEPVSQLDPFAARTFISMIERLNRELGITVIMAEHNLENIFSIANSLTVIDSGRVIYSGAPVNCAKALSCNSKIIKGLPVYAQFHSMLKFNEPCPLNICEASNMIRKNFSNKIDAIEDKNNKINFENKIIELKNICFRYEKNGPDILYALNMSVNKGEIYGIVGGNGSGKSTLLSVITGQNTPYSGKILINGKKIKSFSGIAVLPQNPVTVFTGETIEEDFQWYANYLRMDKSDKRIKNLINDLDLTEILNSHPYDLSGGECQKAAIAKILMKDPDIILLDEPTKGIDAWSKEKLIQILRNLAEGGKTIIIVTHDNEFAAEIADRCALLFDREIISQDNTREFFSSNEFYTTCAKNMTRGFYKNAVTLKDIIDLYKANGGSL